MTPLHLLGCGLLLWLTRDLVAGDVYIHRQFTRAYEPLGYWLGIILWLVVAVSCFYDLIV